MPDIFFENVHTKNRFKVLKFDKEAGTVTLVGKHAAPFEEKYSKDRFEEMGYRPVEVEAAAQVQSPAPPAPPALPATGVIAPPPPPGPTAAVPPPPAA